LIALTAVAWLAVDERGLRMALVVAIGAFAGFALYHAAFGFTGAWKRIITERRGAGLRAQMLLLVGTSLITYPLLAYGLPEFLAESGARSGAFVFSMGVAAAIGATMFGAGMQLGGGCGSGTLFTVGGGSTRMIVTLAAFIAGSLWATHDLPAWRELPRVAPVSLVRDFGPWTALAILAAFAALVVFGTRALERKTHGGVEPMKREWSFWRGPWRPLYGAVALIIVSIATILVVGRPWGITSGFALWGAKIATTFGVDVAAWPYWRGQAGRIEVSVFSDVTSVMNFAIVIGAFGAAMAAGRFKPTLSIGWRGVATAIAGGLLMGYGARLSGGCNIGAYLGGIISGSLHGWVWLVFAFAGSTATVLALNKRA
jgi:uncharacterized membrane protein YedE/YeeE